MIDLKWFSDPTRARKVAAAQRITPAGDQRELYVVLHGRVGAYELSADGPHLRRTIEPGGAFGHRAFFHGQGGAIYMALEPAVLGVVTQQTLDELMQKSPQTVRALLQAASEDESGEAVSLRSSIQSAPEPAPSRRRYGITHPEYQALVFESSATCPSCGHQQRILKPLQSKLREAAPMRYDLRRFYRDFEPVWYDLASCEACSFTAPIPLFAEPRGFSPKIARAALEEIRADYPLDFAAERTADFVRNAHYLGLACAKGFSTAKALNMRLWSALSWLYEDLGDAEQERAACLEAATACDAVLAQGNLHSAQEQRVLLAMCGMLYRGGQTNGLRKLVFEVKTAKDGKKQFVELAEQLQELLSNAPSAES